MRAVNLKSPIQGLKPHRLMWLLHVSSLVAENTDQFAFTESPPPMTDDEKFARELTQDEYKLLFHPVDFEKKPSENGLEKKFVEDEFIPKFHQQWLLLAQTDYSIDVLKRMERRWAASNPPRKHDLVVVALQQVRDQKQYLYRHILASLPPKQAKAAHRWVRRLRSPTPTPAERALLDKTDITYRSDIQFPDP